MKILDELRKHIQTDEEIERFIVEECEQKTYLKGELLSRQNQFNNAVFFVEKGLLRTFYFENGKDITTNFYSEGKIAANINALFKNQPPLYNIEAIENTEVVKCDYQKLEKLFSSSLTAANFGRYILGNLMVEMSKRIASLQYMSAKAKYAQL